MAARVLHLAPHFGGGVGTVLRPLISASCTLGEYEHRLASLEPAGEGTRVWTRADRLPLDDALQNDPARLNDLLRTADLVHLHWWHHPLLHAWMRRSDLPPFRCVLWSHVNGHCPPQNFPPGLADYPDRLVVASPWSLETPQLRAHADAVTVIRSSRGLTISECFRRTLQNPPLVGYVGTVDPIKMHPDFLALWQQAAYEGAHCIVAGGPHHEALRAAAQASGSAASVEIQGPIDDVPSLMQRLDIFAYPLHPGHYGTGEQVVLEAVSAGAVPVVLGTPNECELLQTLDCGLWCADGPEFVATLGRLLRDRDFLTAQQERCRHARQEPFEVAHLARSWHALYAGLLGEPRRAHLLGDGRTMTGLELLLASCAGLPLQSGYQALLEDTTPATSTTPEIPPGCFARTRGTAHHYLDFYPEPGLAHLVRAQEAHFTNEPFRGFRCPT